MGGGNLVITVLRISAIGKPFCVVALQVAAPNVEWAEKILVSMRLYGS